MGKKEFLACPDCDSDFDASRVGDKCPVCGHYWTEKDSGSYVET